MVHPLQFGTHRALEKCNAICNDECVFIVEMSYSIISGGKQNHHMNIYNIILLDCKFKMQSSQFAFIKTREFYINPLALCNGT